MNTIKKLLLSIILISFYAQSQIIDKINITGLNTIDRGTVLNYLPFEAGDFYSTSRDKALSEALLKTGFFKDVIISSNEKILTIEILENPIIKDVIVDMDSEDLVELSKINENLDNFAISKGKIYNKKSLEKFIKQVKEVYSAGGHANAIISHKVIINTDNLAIIDIQITENEVVKIKSMNIIGNEKFSEDDLLDLFSIGEADNFIFNYFTKRDSFSQIALNAGIDKLTNFYLNNGYLDIKITKILKSKTKNGLEVEIHLNEGPIYRIGKITFKNDSELKNTEALKLFALGSNDIFKRSKIVAGIQNITDVLADKGYAFTKVEPKVSERVNGGQHLMDVVINITSNQKVYINRIIIYGNTRTSDDVVRREIGVLEGSLYSNTEIKKSIIRLKRLAFFSDVSMQVSKVKGSSDRINLHFSITETKTGKFSVGISHSNSTGVAFNIGIKEKNIFGTGNELNANLTYSKAVKNINLFFLNPYFTVDGHSISYGIFYKTTDGSKLKSASYKTNKIGVSLGYGIPFTEYSRINASLKLAKINITCGANFAGINYEQKQCANDYNSEFYANLGYVKNTLNNSHFPTNGNKLSINVGVALPLADYRYYKNNISYKKYQPLSKNITLSLKGKVDIAGGYWNRDLPFFERYYGGGSSSVRGFSFNSLGEKYPNGTSKGGKLSVLGSIAIISPLTWVKNSSNMRISAFADIGGIDREVNMNGVNLRASVGVAFVWITPIGPLGIYAAKPIKKETSDDIKTFEFTLGTSF